MSNGIRTPEQTAKDLAALNKDNVAVMPDAWKNMLEKTIQRCMTAIVDSIYNNEEQAFLLLALRIFKAGRHACWAMARESSTAFNQIRWQLAAQWHHDAYATLHAGWIRRLPLGTNYALTVENNAVLITSPVIRVEENADRWLIQLERDPLDIAANEAWMALNTIPLAVWIAP